MLSNIRAFGDRTRRHRVSHQAAAFALLGMIGAATLASQRAVADESGVSFWLPGIFGSLAAVPLPPGWSFSTTNYYTSVSAAKSVDFQIGGGIQAGLNAHVDLQYSTLAYAFPTPVLGGEAVLSMSSILANNNTSVFGTLTGPGGGMISGSRGQSVTGFGDLYPAAQLRWNQGVNNYMTYLTGDIPVGLYDSQNLANIGIQQCVVASCRRFQLRIAAIAFRMHIRRGRDRDEAVAVISANIVDLERAHPKLSFRRRAAFISCFPRRSTAEDGQ